MTLSELRDILNSYPEEYDDFVVTLTYEKYQEKEDAYSIENIELPVPDHVYPYLHKVVFNISEDED